MEDTFADIIPLMKKFLFIASGVIIMASCANGNKHKEKMHAYYKSVYDNALRLGDINVAVQAVYDIIANDSTQTTYYDTLAILYLNTSNTGSTYLATRESLKYKPNNEKMLALAAEYAKNLGMADTAAMWYRKAFVASNKLLYLYDLAQLQYNTGDYTGADATADMMIKSAASDTEMVKIFYDKDNWQSVPVKAAAYNVKATVFMQMGSKEVCLRYLDEALKVFPDFKVAKRNKEEVMNGKIDVKRK
jgi:tetratricopeptide (TPR) repeat protein